MKHIITISKKQITQRRFNKLQLEVAIFEERFGTAGIATDSSGDYYEFDLLSDNSTIAEKMKYFIIGRLNMPELDNN
jgi:hypothetical protein